MRRGTILTGLVCFSLSVAAPAQEDYYYQDGTEPPRETEIPSAGFWPTDRMIELVIDRITEEMGGHYGFDDDQLQNTRLIIKERLPGWLQENRAEIQSLMNTYIEALLGEDPPTAEEVAGMAGRALPLFEELNGMVEGMTEDIKLFMTDEQQVMLNGELAAFDVFMNHGRQRLHHFREGGFDPDFDWHKSPGFDERQHDLERQVQEEAEQARRAAMGLKTLEEGIKPADEAQGKRSAAAGEKQMDEWEQYVEAFIRQYQLDPAQQNSARKYLRTMQEIRDRYLRKRLPEIRKLEDQLGTATTDETRSRVEAQYKQITEPLDRYFGRLKDKLETLPTRKQRAAAAEKAKSAMRERMLKQVDGEATKSGGDGAKGGGSE